MPQSGSMPKGWKTIVSERSTERLAGILLVSSFFLFLGHVVADSTLGHGRASIVFFLLYGFPVSLTGLALYMTFRKHDPILAMFGGFGFASHGLFVVLTAAVLLVGLRFPQEFALFGAESGPVAGIASSLCPWLIVAWAWMTTAYLTRSNISIQYSVTVCLII